MKITDYLRDHIMCIVTNILSILALSLFLVSVGNEIGIICIVIVCWLMVLITYLFIHYYFRRRYFIRLLATVDSLKEKYLISEIMQCPRASGERVYYKILKEANKSMLEQVSAVKRDRKEHKEYVEQWIHEVKTPITAMKLICDNHKSDFSRTLLIELEKVNHFVEQALYFARSENVEKDYLIKETVLSDIVHHAISANQQLLIRSQTVIQLENCDYTVYSDAKWIGFILNQLIVNAVKYQNEKPKLTFSGKAVKGGIELSVSDNGIGIAETDLPRIFEKGFTGKNGRTEKRTTGIGLYLCKNLSLKLGIEITAESQIGHYTTISMFFPKDKFVKVQEE